MTARRAKRTRMTARGASNHSAESLERRRAPLTSKAPNHKQTMNFHTRTVVLSILAGALYAPLAHAEIVQDAPPPAALPDVGHAAPIRALAYAPDGKTVWSVDQTGALLVRARRRKIDDFPRATRRKRHGFARADRRLVSGRPESGPGAALWRAHSGQTARIETDVRQRCGRSTVAQSAAVLRA